MGGSVSEFQIAKIAIASPSFASLLSIWWYTLTRVCSCWVTSLPCLPFGLCCCRMCSVPKWMCSVHLRGPSGSCVVHLRGPTMTGTKCNLHNMTTPQLCWNCAASPYSELFWIKTSVWSFDTLSDLFPIRQYKCHMVWRGVLPRLEFRGMKGTPFKDIHKMI